MKRARYMQLTQVAIKIMDLLDEEKVNRNERCAVDRICNHINDSEHVLTTTSGECCETQPTASC
jgi:hypothetical protein